MKDRLQQFFGDVKELVRGNLFKNIISLQGMQVLNYLQPLILIPFLTRELGVSGWGLFAFAKSFSVYLITIIEYGFNITATRDLVSVKHDRDQMARLISPFIGATLILWFFAIIICVATFLLVPGFHDNVKLTLATFMFATFQGIIPVWYFLGIEEIKKLALIEATSKIIVTILVVVVTSAVPKASSVMFVYAFGAMLTAISSYFILYRRISFLMPSFYESINKIISSFGMFVYRGITTLNLEGNAFILGLMAPEVYVGYYAGAEKIINLCWSFFHQVGRVLFPLIASLVKTDELEAKRILRYSTLILGIASLLVVLILNLLGPFVIRILLGQDFEPSIEPLRILSFMLVLYVFNSTLGIQWMIPKGLDWKYNKASIVSTLVGFAIALILTPSMFHIGMAIAVLSSQILRVSVLGWTLEKLRINPFRS